MKDLIISVGLVGVVGLLLTHHDRYEQMIGVAFGADQNGMVAMRPYQVVLMFGGLIALALWSAWDNHQDTNSPSRFMRWSGWFGVATSLFVAAGVLYKLFEVLQ